MPNLSVSICHYETPLRRRGNLTNLVAYEIASIVPLSRNDTTTNLIRRMDSRALQGILQSCHETRMRGSAAAYDTSAIKLPKSVNIAPISKIPIIVG